MNATMVLNSELNGIEISFDEKPVASVLDCLKGAGFRWHKVKKMWYAKQTPERLELAGCIAEIKGTQAAPSPASRLCGSVARPMTSRSMTAEPTQKQSQQRPESI